MFKNLQNLFHFLFGWLSPSPTIKWVKSSGPSDSAKPAIFWVVADGKLLLDYRDCTPRYPMTKADLEAALQRLKDKIGNRQITVDAIYIETHIATGLWNEGVITRAHLESADGRFGGTTFEMELLGEQFTVSIQRSTYYADYEFIVGGIPDVRRVRDLPDALAKAAGEDTSF